MKIVFYLPNIRKGGGSRSQIFLANYLYENNYDVTILTHNNHNDFDINIPILKSGFIIKNKMVSFIVNTFFSCIDLSKYDLIITSLITNLFIINLFLNKKKIYHFARHYDPYLLDSSKIRNKFVLKCYKFCCNLSYKTQKCFFVNSAWTANEISKNIHKKINATKIVNGVDLDLWYKENQMNSSEEKIYTIGIIGKSQKWKGLDEAIEVVRKLRSLYDIKLLVISSESELIVNDENWIQIVNPISDDQLRTYYNSLDLFISTSWYEGFCNPPLEAMACGVPTVITNSGGVLEYAINGYNTLISEPRDLETLKDNIVRIKGDSSLRESIVANGLKTAKKFSWEKSCKDFIKKIEDISSE